MIVYIMQIIIRTTMSVKRPTWENPERELHELEPPWENAAAELHELFTRSLEIFDAINWYEAINARRIQQGMEPIISPRIAAYHQSMATFKNDIEKATRKRLSKRTLGVFTLDTLIDRLNSADRRFKGMPVAYKFEEIEETVRCAVAAAYITHDDPAKENIKQRDLCIKVLKAVYARAKNVKVIPVVSQREYTVDVFMDIVQPNPKKLGQTKFSITYKLHSGKPQFERMDVYRTCYSTPGHVTGLGHSLSFESFEFDGPVFEMNDFTEATASQILDWPTKSNTVKITTIEDSAINSLTNLIMQSGIFSISESGTSTLCRASFTDCAL